MFKSFRTQSQQRSPLLETLKVRGGGGAKKSSHRELAVALPLTSLIDAFSIIVIYLLIGTQSGAVEVPVPLMNLPVASYSQSIDSTVSILRIQNNNYFLNDKPVSAKNLNQELAQLKKNSTEKSVELMIQADQNMDYADLDPLIKAGSLAGIEKLKFAVMPSK